MRLLTLLIMATTASAGKLEIQIDESSILEMNSIRLHLIVYDSLKYVVSSSEGTNLIYRLNDGKEKPLGRMVFVVDLPNTEDESKSIESFVEKFLKKYRSWIDVYPELWGMMSVEMESELRDRIESGKGDMDGDFAKVLVRPRYRPYNRQNFPLGVLNIVHLHDGKRTEIFSWDLLKKGHIQERGQPKGSNAKDKGSPKGSNAKDKD